MKKTLSLLIGLVGFASVQAQAGSLNSSFAGDYSKDVVDVVYPSEEGGREFTISADESSLEVIDNEKGLVYSMDLSDPGEQEISYRALSYIKSHPRLKAFSSLIDKVTLSDANLSEAGKKVTASVNVYISRNSWFGNLNARVKVDMSVKLTTNCSRHTQMGSVDSINVSCIQVNTDDIEVTSLKTSLGSEADRVIGLTSDLFLKIATLNQKQPTLYKLK
jgi:hypothetical protein